jgi:hypothetical protein
LPLVVVLPEPCRPHIIRTVTLILPLEMERMIDRPHKVDERLIDDADDLLAGIERLENRVADRFVGDPLHEVADDGEADVGFQQRTLDELEPVAHVRFGELPLPRRVLKRTWRDRLEGLRT